MFLYMLNDSEKENFIALARFAASCNEDVSAEEEIMLHQYCDEMGIAMPEYNGESLEQILEKFSMSNIRNKKVVVLEIVGLLFSDGEYDKKEQEFIGRIANALGVSPELAGKYMELTGRYLGVLSEIVQALE